jgi:small subunit ribosomal protein S27Ae
VGEAIVSTKGLHGGDFLAMNQLVRWINTKEDHCAKIISTVAGYCLCQRVKKELFKSDSDYADALKAHHSLMQCATKAKQAMGEAAYDALDHALADFAKMYLPVE